MENTDFWQTLYQKSQVEVRDEAALKTIQLHHDLSQFAEVNTATANWVPSPAKGVTRLMLDRDGGEKTTRATSIVAYSPQSHFSPHTHPKGEEFLVLTGTFSDENGDYPKGTYVRNPPKSSHQPFSVDGCLIFVKLQQFSPRDERRVVQHIQQENPTARSQQQLLFDDYERVQFIHFDQEAPLAPDLAKQGVEILILTGSLTHGLAEFRQGHWLRVPPKTQANITVRKGSRLFVKSGHLGDPS